MSFPTPETLAVSTTGAGLNLAAAVGNLASRTGVVLRYARYLLRWLERSGVDEKNVERCMTAARGLAYPKEDGLQLSQSTSKPKKRIQNFKMN